ncbi:bifunctional DNA-binding transcriptional regulator/O6-methylguanine-DNA methyltransferase Ada [Leptolyngbya sp. FACHB-16]|uniref:bifunctional DNA-binding transcriptional regulator/O6-methylguanine-DNA methyltransferase Ada n=1 Tax=unclassified Leptolyngbya TaxID=2650499 RepID=UPI001681F8C9|nr:bifunctional DNA-binding transcriptional regulator/O6-methylguanine-DNA methyltransferase Ada [Leptolyngbya sp. FACHB-16]MBD2158601.1 bifunctional DNA-binding transcriptional regulator/O6-methylguanine-DNA methyltransferase Ada [Leptolyngbya sp. FACHB-16]
MEAMTIANFSTDAERWDALVNRNTQAEGTFFYGVKTTGVFCRPTCSSRLPKRDNVVFFEQACEAEQAGFRPCKRCQPKGASPRQEQVAAIAQLCHHIRTSDSPLSLKEMAAEMSLSPYHFHRLFREIVGVTPKQYTQGHRAQRVREGLQTPQSVTEALYEAGFESNSSFYGKASQHLGMTPTQYKRGAAGMTIYYAIRPSWLGLVLVALTERGVCAIALDNSAEVLTQHLHQIFPKATLKEADEGFAEWITQALTLVEQPDRAIDLPLDIQGTAFQQQVWQALQKIPAGQTITYSELAERIGNPKAVRAVASACGSNRVAIAIPCHRVIGRDGSLTGYRWGKERKQALLAREQNGSKGPK